MPKIIIFCCSWTSLIDEISRKKKNFNYLKRMHLSTASKYTWDKRVKIP